MNWHTRVREVMTRNPVTVDIDDPPSRIQEVLGLSPFHHLIVMENGVVAGVISTIDLARVSLGVWVEDARTQQAWLDAAFTVRELMTAEPDSINVDDPVKLAADRLAHGSYHCLPVLDDNSKLVGIVTSTDLLRWLVIA
jgi:acetoin utilization protein AcuB